jgi:hypothetical protein
MELIMYSMALRVTVVNPAGKTLVRISCGTENDGRYSKSVRQYEAANVSLLESEDGMHGTVRDRAADSIKRFLSVGRVTRRTITEIGDKFRGYIRAAEYTIELN